MLWGLDSGEVEALREYQGQIRSAVEQLTWGFKDPQKAMDYLVPHPDDPEADPLEVEDLSKWRDPKEVAYLLLQRLDEKLTSDSDLEGIYPPIYPR